MEAAIIIAIIIWGIIFGGFCAFLAKQKNRDAVGWFFLGLLFSIIALIAIAASSPKENKDTLQVKYEPPKPMTRSEKTFIIILAIVMIMILIGTILSTILKK